MALQTTILIAGATLPVGNAIIGSGAVTGGWSSVTLTIDHALQIGPVLLAVEYAPDGVTYQRIAFGTWAVNDTNPMSATFDPPLPANASASFRVVAENSGLAFVSTGGSLVIA